MTLPTLPSSTTVWKEAAVWLCYYIKQTLNFTCKSNKETKWENSWLISSCWGQLAWHKARPRQNGRRLQQLRPYTAHAHMSHSSVYIHCNGYTIFTFAVTDAGVQVWGGGWRRKELACPAGFLNELHPRSKDPSLIILLLSDSVGIVRGMGTGRDLTKVALKLHK